MERITSHLPFLHLLLTTHPHQKQALLKTATKLQLQILCEILLNIIKGNLKISKTEEKFLNKKKKIISKLLNKSGKPHFKQRLFSKNLKVVDLIVHSFLNKLKNEQAASTEVHPSAN